MNRCIEQGCKQPSAAHGKCHKHYQRDYRADKKAPRKAQATATKATGTGKDTVYEVEDKNTKEFKGYLCGEHAMKTSDIRVTGIIEAPCRLCNQPKGKVKDVAAKTPEAVVAKAFAVAEPPPAVKAKARGTVLLLTSFNNDRSNSLAKALKRAYPELSPVVGMSWQEERNAWSFELRVLAGAGAEKKVLAAFLQGFKNGAGWVDEKD